MLAEEAHLVVHMLLINIATSTIAHSSEPIKEMVYRNLLISVTNSFLE